MGLAARFACHGGRCYEPLGGRVLFMPTPAVPWFLMLGSPLQLLVIVLILLLLFGAGRLGDIGKGLGEGIRNFKKGFAGDDKKIKSPDPAPPSAANGAAGPRDPSQRPTAAKPDP